MSSVNTQTRINKNRLWNLNKFFNKFIASNLISTIGFVMLLLSAIKQEAFKQDQVVANIVVSALVTFLGMGLAVACSLLLKHKGQKPHYEKLAFWLMCLSWLPLCGLVLAILWQQKEIKYICQQTGKKHKFSIPNSITIIFGVSIFVITIIWMFYLSGALKPSTELDKDGNLIEQVPGILDIFFNPIKGFTQIVDIVIFLFVFSGMMALVNESRAIEAGIGHLSKKLKGKEIIMIPILMLILGVCGTVYGSCEDTLPYFLIVIPFFYAAGYDRMTGFLVVFLSAGIGVMTSTLNPFIINTCIKAMGDVATQVDPHVTVTNGIVWRLAMFIVLITIAIVTTMLYARKVKKDPKKSYVYMSQEDFSKTYSFDKNTLLPITRKHIWTLIIFGFAFVTMIICFIDWQTLTGFTGFKYLTTSFKQICPFGSSWPEIGKWSTLEASILFFIASLLIGIVNWQGAGHWFSTFYRGCSEMIGVGFVISVARGIKISLTTSGFDGMVATSISGVLSSIGVIGTILIIFIIISLLTLFIPSTSSLSSAMMPLFSQAIVKSYPTLLTGSITTFSAAMGWVNLFTPTGMVLPFLEVSKMNIVDFGKTAWKQLLILLVAGVAMLIIGSFLPKGIF